MGIKLPILPPSDPAAEHICWLNGLAPSFVTVQFLSWSKKSYPIPVMALPPVSPLQVPFVQVVGNVISYSLTLGDYTMGFYTGNGNSTAGWQYNPLGHFLGGAWGDDCRFSFPMDRCASTDPGINVGSVQVVSPFPVVAANDLQQALQDLNFPQTSQSFAENLQTSAGVSVLRAANKQTKSCVHLFGNS